LREANEVMVKELDRRENMICKLQEELRKRRGVDTSVRNN
jgi:hypothetical protein